MVDVLKELGTFRNGLDRVVSGTHTKNMICVISFKYKYKHTYNYVRTNRHTGMPEVWQKNNLLPNGW